MSQFSSGFPATNGYNPGGDWNPGWGVKAKESLIENKK